MGNRQARSRPNAHTVQPNRHSPGESPLHTTEPHVPGRYQPLSLFHLFQRPTNINVRINLTFTAIRPESQCISGTGCDRRRTHVSNFLQCVWSCNSALANPCTLVAHANMISIGELHHARRSTRVHNYRPQAMFPYSQAVVEVSRPARGAVTQIKYLVRNHQRALLAGSVFGGLTRLQAVKERKSLALTKLK